MCPAANPPPRAPRGAGTRTRSRRRLAGLRRRSARPRPRAPPSPPPCPADTTGPRFQPRPGARRSPRPSPPDAAVQHARAHHGKRSPACSDPLVVEVLDYLVRPRPLVGRHDEIDVAAAEAIDRPIGDAGGVDAELTEPVAPPHGGRLLLERA